MKSYDVEQRAGIRRGYLSQLENGNKTPRPETLRRIESALDVSPTTLLMLSVDKEQRDKMGPGADTLSLMAIKNLLQWP